MSRSNRAHRAERERQCDPGRMPTFNDPELQRAFEEARLALDASRDAAAWREDETVARRRQKAEGWATMRIKDIPTTVLAASRELSGPKCRPTPTGWPDEAVSSCMIIEAWIQGRINRQFVGTKMDARAIESVRHVANELVAFLIPWACAHITVDQAARSVQFTIMPNPTLPFADRERIDAAIELAVRYGGIEGDHHKAWVIDQMVRALAGDRYAEIVRDAKVGDDGPETYEWDEGIPP